MASAALGRLAIAALALTILWRIIQVNAVLYEDTGRPRLPSFASTGIGEAPPEREVLRAVLRENPAQVAALLLVARDFERQSDPAGAARAYAAAYQLAPLDREVLHAGSVFFLGQGRITEAAVLLGRLVEYFPDTRARAFPVIADILASRQHADAVSAITARDPEWLGPFIVASCQGGVDPAILLPLFMKRVAAASAQPAETACLVGRLRGAGRWEEAYQVWLNTLPRERLNEVGFIFNGGFEFAPSGVGFDWIPERQPEREVGHAVEMARSTGGAGKRSLKVSYNGKRQTANPIAQYLVLPPGRYELSGLGRSDGMRAGRGVHWTVRCVEDAKPGAVLANSERFLGSSEWRAFSFELTVAAECRGQILQLEPVGVEESAAYLTGAAWFDDLALRRIR
jgi:hypothetical protein